jgi:hypothetical protein
MLFQTIKSGDNEVQIYRKKNMVKNGYEYYLRLLTNGYCNDNYKQIESIYSLKNAIKEANRIL